jgi:hypothetical protein
VLSRYLSIIQEILLKGLLFFFSFIIIVSAYTKKKQTIIFGYYIENSISAAEMKPCFVYILSGHKYIWDRILSNYYSEYYRKQVSYNNLSNK